MAKLCLSLLLILLSIFSLSSTVEPAFSGHTARRSRARANIEAACRTTRYPDLCVHCLTTYVKPNMTIQSPQQLAQVALTASLYRALYARAFVLKVAKELNTLKRENQVVRDCLQQINDSVDQLSGSIKELRRLGQESVGDDLFWHISNVETWVGTALTDANDCVNALPGPNMSKLKATIKGKMLNVAQTASNALALFHSFAARYKAASATKKP
ncbi:pectinesterase inhibitor 9 [Rosa sericea]|uniref:Putative pectinesterase n=1 Tax=Rosa chinensis TaxID=74649 RepID=A0A2P6SFW0_ROSCH|nr:pectinesterase inhibitor 9 [Rosa chinensis]PRQ57563.1 putative pectinesterase [Rosa chinensis]